MPKSEEFTVIKDRSNSVHFGLTLLIMMCVAIMSVQATAQTASQNSEQDTVRVIEPETDTDTAKPARIDTERYEIGLLMGMMAIEDFNSNLVRGLSFAYHLDEIWLISVQLGETEASPASFERIADERFLAAGSYKLTYNALMAGYQIIRGRSFYRSAWKYDSSLFLLAGLEQVEFADNSTTGLVLGVSYRIVKKDWMTVNLDYKNHIFKREFLGDSKQTMNNELNLGINFLF